MYFELTDINGKAVFAGSLQEMRSWFLSVDQRRLYVLLQLKSWHGRDDVVSLYCLDADGSEHFQLNPELTRQFLSQVP